MAQVRESAAEREARKCKYFGDPESPKYDFYFVDECKWCYGATRIIGMTKTADGTVRRTRKCVKCGKMYETHEIRADLMRMLRKHVSF